jgi:hypothetical protein
MNGFEFVIQIAPWVIAGYVAMQMCRVDWVDAMTALIAVWRCTAPQPIEETPPATLKPPPNPVVDRVKTQPLPALRQDDIYNDTKRTFNSTLLKQGDED